MDLEKLKQAVEIVKMLDGDAPRCAPESSSDNGKIVKKLKDYEKRN